MTEDLRRALDDLAARTTTEHQDRGGLPVTEMTARAGRARHRRTALLSGAVAAALVVVAGTGYAVTRWDRGAEPLPADTPTVTTAPSPTPAPTAPEQTLPVGDASLPFGECGSLVGSPTVPAADSSAYVELVAPSSAARGAAIEIRARSMAPAEASFAFTHDSGPRAVVAKDGVVVATIDAHAEVSDGADLYAAFSGDVDNWEAQQWFVTHATPVVCDDGAASTSVGTDLPAGDYEVYALGETWWAQGIDPEGPGLPLARTFSALGDFDGRRQSTALGGPVALQIEEQQGDRQVPLVGAPSLPAPTDYGSACSIVPGADLGDDFTIATPETLRVHAGDTYEEYDVGVTVTYGGPGRVAGQVSIPDLLLLEDGKAVGEIQQGLTVVRFDVDGGSAIELAVGGLAPTVRRCGADGWPANESEVLAPGTYQVMIAAYFFANAAWDSDGVQVLDSAPDDSDATTFTTVPFTLVVE